MEQLRVNTAALQTMAAQCGASAGELTHGDVPAVTGALTPPSASAISTAHLDVGFFPAKLAARIDLRAHVVDANANFMANQARSAHDLAALSPSPAAV